MLNNVDLFGSLHDSDNLSREEEEVFGDNGDVEEGEEVEVDNDDDESKDEEDEDRE